MINSKKITIMRKFLLLLLSLQIITSCGQRVKSNSDSVDSSDENSEISATPSEGKKSDNIIVVRSDFAQVDSNTVRITKDSPDYVSAVNEMKSLEKQRQRLIEKINQKYSQYLAYNIWERDYVLQKSSHDVINAAMREERLSSY